MDNEKSKRIVKQFIAKKLNNNIENLKTYNFQELKKDNKLGCKGRRFEADDTDAARAIYCLIYEDMFNDINLNIIGASKKYRGKKINEFNTLFSKSLDETLSKGYENSYDSLHIGSKKKGFDITNKAFIKNIVNFHNASNTIGNMILLPEEGRTNVVRTDWDNAKKEDIETKRNESLREFISMTNPGFGDYFDTFLAELHRYYINEPCTNEFRNLAKKNEFYFGKFGKKKDGFINFCQKNFLNDYIKDNKVTVLFKHGKYGWWTMNSMNEYEDFSNKYLAKATKAINNRSNIIISILKKKLK